MGELKVCFITTVGRNPGDAFIRLGLEYLVRQSLPVYRALYVDKHDLRTLQLEWDYLIRQPEAVRGLLARWLRFRGATSNALEAADVIFQAGTPFYYRLPVAGPPPRVSTSITTDWIRDIWLDRLLRNGTKAKVAIVGVGTCQAFHSDGAEIAEDGELAAFVRQTVNLASVTTVRERIAARVLGMLGCECALLPCPAVFAPDAQPGTHPTRRFVVMNYLPSGGHYELGQSIDSQQWRDTFVATYHRIVAHERVVVVCHAAKDLLETRKILPGCETFFSARPEDYIRMYSGAKYGIVNRVHAAVLMAGFGCPAVVVGNDTRALMAEELGLPVLFVNDATEEQLLGHLASFDRDADAWEERLLVAKEAARKAYVDLLRRALDPTLRAAAGEIDYQVSDSALNVTQG